MSINTLRDAVMKVSLQRRKWGSSNSAEPQLDQCNGDPMPSSSFPLRRSSIIVLGKLADEKSLAGCCLLFMAAVFSQVSFSEFLPKRAYASWGPPNFQQPQYVPRSDPIFAGLPVSKSSFAEVRKRYTSATEALQPMALVKLPDDFQGDYRPKSIQEFVDLSLSLLHDMLDDEYPERKSDYAILSICIGMDLCTVTPRNHQAYADKHGYDYIIATYDLDGVHPKMLKYFLSTWAMKRGYKWVMMMDADALFMNLNITIPSVLQDAQVTNDTTLLLTRGGNWRSINAINNGVFLMRTSDWSIKHCFDVFTARWAYTKFLGRTLIDQPLQASILLAQGEIQWPPQEETEQGRRVTIARKRSINAFYRDAFYRARDEKEGLSWQRGDFIAHFASGHKYSTMINLLTEEGLESSIPPVEKRFPFPLPLPVAQISERIGSCWCEDADELHCMPSNHVIGVHQAGTKSVMKYIDGHFGVISTGFMGDKSSWLTEKMANTERILCRKALNQNKRPAYIQDNLPSITSCSFRDYTMIYGQQLVKNGVTCSATSSLSIPIEIKDKPLLDEMAIWDQTFDIVRGVPLPQVLHMLQPLANLIVSVRDPINVVYSAYNSYDGFFHEKSPQHFDSYVRNLTQVWTENNCSPSNFSVCLPMEYASSGSWLARGMYSRHLTEWLKYFPCSQLHIFDMTAERTTEVERMYTFMGVSNPEVAATVTSDTNVPSSVDKSEKIVTPIPPPMLTESYLHLEEFFAPHRAELCSLMQKYSCLNIPLFQSHCEEEVLNVA